TGDRRREQVQAPGPRIRHCRVGERWYGWSGAADKRNAERIIDNSVLKSDGERTGMLCDLDLPTFFTKGRATQLTTWMGFKSQGKPELNPSCRTMRGVSIGRLNSAVA